MTEVMACPVDGYFVNSLLWGLVQCRRRIIRLTTTGLRTRLFESLRLSATICMAGCSSLVASMAMLTRVCLSHRRLMLIAVAIVVAWGAPSRVDAASCGSYLHRASDLLLLSAQAELITRSAAQRDYTIPKLPCHGPNCGEQSGVPATPPPLVRSDRAHDPLLAIVEDFESNHSLGSYLSVSSERPIEGYPTRVKRPPRR